MSGDVDLPHRKDCSGDLMQMHGRVMHHHESLVPWGLNMSHVSQVPSQNGITSDDHLGMPASAPVAPAVLRSLPNGSHAAANGNMPKHLVQAQSDC